MSVYNTRVSHACGYGKALVKAKANVLQYSTLYIAGFTVHASSKKMQILMQILYKWQKKCRRVKNPKKGEK